MKKNTFILTVIGTVASILLTVVYTLLLNLMASLSFSAFAPDAPVIALRENTMFFIFGAFLIFEIIFFVYLFSSMAKEKSDKQDGVLLGGKSINNKKKSKITLTKTTKIAGVVGIVILVGMLAFNAGIYTEVSKDSIKKKTFITTQEYTWNDVYRYTFSCDENAELQYTVQMTDGKSFQILVSSNSCSDEFIEEFGDVLTFAYYLSCEFENCDRKIIKDIVGLEYMEQHYKPNESDWSKIEKIINVGNTP